MLELFKTVFAHEMKLYYRRKMDVVNAFLFFLLVIILFPIGIGPQPEVLKALSLGVIWVAAIFSAMFGARMIFEADAKDGTLNQYLTTPANLEIVSLAKIAANWAAFCLPVVLVSPIAAGMFGFDFADSWMLALTLLLGTPVFAMIGGIGSALSLGSKKGRLLQALLVMPLYIPILIFGVNTSYIFLENVDGQTTESLMIIFGLMLITIPLSAFACALAIRND